MMRILYLGLILIHTLNFTEHLLSIIYRAFTEHLLSFAISNLSYCITIKIIISSAYFFLFFIFFLLLLNLIKRIKHSTFFLLFYLSFFFSSLLFNFFLFNLFIYLFLIYFSSRPSRSSLLRQTKSPHYLVPYLIFIYTIHHG